MKKEIIGYKLTKPEYEQAAVLICKEKNKNTSIEDFKIQKNGTSFLVPTRAYDWLKEAGVLDLWFEPVYKEEFKIVPGKWYLTKLGSIYYCEEIKENTTWTGKEIWGYGIDSNRLWTTYTNLCFEFDIVREATKEEVEKVLINEAKRRYPVGTKYKTVIAPNEQCGVYGQNFVSWENEYYPPLTAIVEEKSPGILYYKGKWAEVAQDGPILTFGNKKVTINKGYVESDDNKFINIEIEDLVETLSELTISGYDVEIKSLKIGCTQGTMEQLREIYENLIW